MSADIGAWNSHGWNIRRLEAAPGVDVTEYTCVSCARHFLEEEGTTRDMRCVLEFDNLIGFQTR